jgi:5-deoxy-glucuronate isomerase
VSGHPLHRPRGSAASGPYDVALGPADAGWGHAGLHVLTLVAGSSHLLEAGEREQVLVPLAGGVRVEVEAPQRRTVDLEGRPSVFSGPTDVLYLPRGSRALLTPDSTGPDAVSRVALASAPAAQGFPIRHVLADDVPVELRGRGSCSREVHDLGTPGVLDAASIIVCEVLTPGGNWSSYPPHKHDEDRPGETVLEEVYYFEVAGGPDDAGVAYQRVYGTDERPLDLLAEVRDGDVVLVPHGWHGPSMAAPGYDLYYLNVMAGPGPERAWRICDDPVHAWVRGTWDDQDVDPRLPFGR